MHAIATRFFPMGSVVFAVAAVTLATPSVAAGQDSEWSEDLEQFNGLTIVHVELDRRDLFDTDKPDTSGWPFRAANAINVVTREGFIRRALLFADGDTFDAKLARESARALRSTGFLNPVEIHARELGDGVEVKVMTRDEWSLQIGGNLSIFGGSSSTGIGIGDKNVFGTGQSVATEYSRDEDRTEWSFDYRNPFVFGSRWRFEGRYRDRSDGKGWFVRAGRPFFALRTRSAYGGKWGELTFTDELRGGAEDVVEGWHDQTDAAAWYGFRVAESDRRVHRLVFGFEERRDHFENWTYIDDGRPYETPDDRDIIGPSLGYETILDRFDVVRGYRAWTLQEDLSLGLNARAGLVASAPVFGGDRRRLVIDALVKYTSLTNGWVLRGSFAASGRLEENTSLANGHLGIELVAAQLGQRGWRARVLFENTRDADRDQQLTLGADQGLRGWEPDFFDGTGRAVVNLEYRRLLIDNLWDTVSVGVGAFADAGATWNPRVAADTDGVRADMGLSLLVELTKFSAQQLIRLDLALPDDGSGVLFSVKTSTLF